MASLSSQQTGELSHQPEQREAQSSQPKLPKLHILKGTVLVFRLVQPSAPLVICWLGWLCSLGNFVASILCFAPQTDLVLNALELQTVSAIERHVCFMLPAGSHMPPSCSTNQRAILLRRLLLVDVHNMHVSHRLHHGTLNQHKRNHRIPDESGFTEETHA